MPTLCLVAKCANPIETRGLCRGHYQVAWKSGFLAQTAGPLPIAILEIIRGHKLRQNARTPCSIDGCDKPVKAWSMCPTHYTRAARRLGRRNNPRACAVQECMRPAYCGGLCNSHYDASLRSADRERYNAYYRNFRGRHPERRRAQERKWANANPDLVWENTRNQRARRNGATGKFTADDWRALVDRSTRCYWCKLTWTKTRRPTHDHVIPIAKGGDNSPENSVCACKRCNSRKSASRFDPNTGQGILL